MRTTKTEVTRESWRRARVRQIFEDRDWGNVELLEGWDGKELDELRSILSDEEFETLLDELAETEERA